MKIIFVCTGNTCRSSMAEAMMKKKCLERKIDIECMSAGISAFSGDTASENAIRAMSSRNIDLSSHRSKRLTPYHIEENDLVVCMTKAHAAALQGYGEKITTLGEDIPDPYGGDTDSYSLCADKISKCLDGLILRLYPSEVLLRPMKQEDVAAVAEIERECFSAPWSEKGIRDELSNEGAHFFVAERRGEVIGYGGMHTVLDEGYIANIAVKGNHRKIGVGSALVAKLTACAYEKGCSFLSLEVRKSNSPAIALYKKFGFESQGERKNFYTGPTENALIMTKYFSEE